MTDVAGTSSLAVHRTILVVDVEGFGGRNRTPDQVAVRDGLYGALERAFHKAGIPWADCHHEDRGDGVFVLAPADVPKGPFVESLPTRWSPRSATTTASTAAACLGYADVVDPDQVRLDVQTAVRRLIPPTSYDAAEMLAKAGPFVIDLLPGPADLTGPNQNEVAGRVIRTLALVGGEEAWEMIRPFAAMHHSTVVDELLRAWRQFEFATEYARAPLSHVDFGDRVLPVRRWSLLPRLHHLKTLRAVRLLGDVALADPRAGQYPLSDIPRLRRLEIQANENLLDLEPLTRCPVLHTLSISGYSKLTDLSALARRTVVDLTLHVQGRTPRQAPPDLATLAGAPLRRLAIRHPWLAAGRTACRTTCR